MSTPERTRLRAGSPQDLHAILALRDALAVDPNQHHGGRGGFLLGSSPDRYQAFLELGMVEVLEHDRALRGFSIVLPDELLRQSDTWQRRESVDWEGLDPRTLESSRVAYLDQLALEDGTIRHLAPLLACRVMDKIFATHDHMLTTTVIAPWCNEAALPMLRAIGAKKVGELDEVYEKVGPLRSAIHHLPRTSWLEHRAHNPLVQRVYRHMEATEYA